MKTRYLILFVLMNVFSLTNAQCKYEYREKDIITNDLNFVTERFILSKNEKKEKVYAVKNLTARFEKKGKEGAILINYNIINTFGRLVVYKSQDDSLVVRFDNGDVRALKMNKMASMNITSVSYKVDLAYQLDEAFIKALKGKFKVVGMRITSTNFNIDIGGFDNDLSVKFNECWID